MKTLYAMKGERWEQLCWRAYRRSTEELTMALREANRSLASSMTSVTFEGGETITVPVIDIPAAIKDVVEAPPWAS